MNYVDVILPLPLDGVFTYLLPDNMCGKLQIGMRIRVPMGKSKVYTAICYRIHNEKPTFDVRPIMSILDTTPTLLPLQLKLWQWISDYYLAALGDIYKAALPAKLKADNDYRPKRELYITLTESYRNKEAILQMQKEMTRALLQQRTLKIFLEISGWNDFITNACEENIKEITREELINESNCSVAIVQALCKRGILTTYTKEVARVNSNVIANTINAKRLSLPQEEAYNKILMQFLRRDVVLLHGVTSSGKTEIYIHLIEKAIKEKKQVLYLLPEIALTIQITTRLRNIFGGRLGIYHSKYSDAERVEIWQKQLSDNPYDVILGARSAVFLPFKKLGLVIVDEEHETSFKQQDPAPRYHARSVAIVIAKMCGAKVLLGTATPSIETYFNATHGKYGMVSLSTRYKDIKLPKIEIVDIKDLHRRKMMTGVFSPKLISAMREALDNKEQVILFQNRRGFAPMIMCKVCGWVPHCTNCDVSLTLHKSLNRLTCHYCGYTYSVPSKCPCCESTDLRERGYGTEKIQEQVINLFPNAKVARMDLDTTRTKNAYERIIEDFSQGKTNLLIGTQMISKGLDFGNVSVVGIIDADSMLNYPDFRSHEMAFTMIAQVSGRAGRKKHQGHVFLQTSNPTLPLIGQVVNNNYKDFFQDVLIERKDFFYPPFSHLVYVYLKHIKDSIVESAAIEMGSRLRIVFGDRILGPDKPQIAKVKTLSIRKIVIKLEKGINLNNVKEHLLYIKKEMLMAKNHATLHIYYDIDPQ